MKKNYRRLFAFISCVAMLFTAIPATAAAGDGPVIAAQILNSDGTVCGTYLNFNDAFNALGANQTIQLLEDCTWEEMIRGAVKNPGAIDLNGHKLTVSNIYIYIQNDFVIKDSTGQGELSIVSLNTGAPFFINTADKSITLQDIAVTIQGNVNDYGFIGGNRVGSIIIDNCSIRATDFGSAYTAMFNGVSVATPTSATITDSFIYINNRSVTANSMIGQYLDMTVSNSVILAENVKRGFSNCTGTFTESHLTIKANDYALYGTAANQTTLGGGYDFSEHSSLINKGAIGTLGDWSYLTCDTSVLLSADFAAVAAISTNAECSAYTREVTPATCIASGYTDCSCTCGYNYSAIYTFTGEHEMTYHSAKDSTCLVNGNVEYWTCSGCGKNYGDHKGTLLLDSVSAPLSDEHIWGNWQVVTQATELNDGQKKRTCTVCAKDEYAPIPAFGLTEPVASGDFGASGSAITYSVYELDTDQYRLVVSGSGKIMDCTWDGQSQPFRQYSRQITELVIGEGITATNNGCFAGMDALVTVSFPSTLTYLASNTFIGSFADSVTTLTIPATVTKIGAKRVNGAYKMGDYPAVTGTAFETIYIENPHVVFEDATNANTFNSGNISNLTLIVSAGGNNNNVKTYASNVNCKYLDTTAPGYVNVTDSINNVRYVGSGGNLTISTINTAAATTIVVPDVVKNQASVFTKVVFELGITAIPDQAFMDFVNLETIVLTSGLRSIGAKAFATTDSCETPLTINIPKSVTALNANAFENRKNVSMSLYLGSKADELFGEKTDDGWDVDVTKTFKLLLIGNSFSRDASQYKMLAEWQEGSKLYEMLQTALGDDVEILIGLCMNGGKTMGWHATQAKNNTAQYTFVKCENNVWSTVANSTTSAYALSYTDWDAVSLQPYSTETTTGQVSASEQAVTDAEFYKLLDSTNYMIDYTDKYAPQAKIYFYMTWRGQRVGLNAGLSAFYNGVTYMIDPVFSGPYSGRKLNGIIPVATAVQNARSTYLALLDYNSGAEPDLSNPALSQKNDINIGLHRDSEHLSLNIGRYMASLTFVGTLVNGVDIAAVANEVPFNESEAIGKLPQDYMDIVVASVQGALANKGAVTTIEGKAVDPATQAADILSAATYTFNLSNIATVDDVKIAATNTANAALAALKTTYPELHISTEDITVANFAVPSSDTTYTVTIPVQFGYTTKTATVTMTAVSHGAYNATTDSYTATLQEALDNANAGDTIQLMTDSQVVSLDQNVIIDLNGHTLSVEEDYLATNAYQAVIDTVGNGKLYAPSMCTYGNNAGYMPIYLDGAYCFTSFTLTVIENDHETIDNKVRFWFKLSFDDSSIYDLIVSDQLQMEIGIDIAVGEQVFDATFSKNNSTQAFAADWAASAKENDNIWLFADIFGISDLSDIDSIMVTPTVTVNGLNNEITNGSQTYLINA